MNLIDKLTIQLSSPCSVPEQDEFIISEVVRKAYKDIPNLVTLNDLRAAYNGVLDVQDRSDAAKHLAAVALRFALEAHR